MIEPIQLFVANVFLVRGEKNILVDTGKAGNERAILAALAKKGVQPQDVDLILLTHGHGDHAGSAKALREKTGAPIAVHAGDVAMIRRGSNGANVPLGLESTLLHPFFDMRFASTEPDIVLQADHDLRQYGLEADLLHTPGHSDGSISLIFDNGEAIIGDLLRGGMMTGRFFRNRPNYPYVLLTHDHMSELHTSIRRLLDTNAKTFYVGHGGSLSALDVERWFASRSA